MGKEHAGEITNLLCNQEIMLHETLNRRATRPVGIAHPRRNLALNVERQPLFTASGDGVEVATHRP